MSEISSGSSPEIITTGITKIFDSALRKFRIFPDDGAQFSKLQRTLALLATNLSLAFGAVFALALIVFGIKMEMWQVSVFGALSMLIAGLVLHFLLSRFAYAGHVLIKNSCYTMPSKNILEVLGLLFMGFSVLVVSGGAYFASQTRQVESFFIALGVGVVIFVVALLLVNAKACLNIQVSSEDGNASDIAIGLLTIVARLLLQFSPIVAFLALAAGTVGGLALIVMVIADKFDMGILASLPIALPLIALPFFTYFGYIFFMLGIELWKSILGIARDTQIIAKK
ncbi:MAG: hypothetical protein LBT33_03725 [Spirochaetia bacterium]|jgi:hypothetical protein|nr:hypothetical protein [Spirochaetia bacterium]